MNEWMYVCMNEWEDVWMNEWMYVWMNECMYECMLCIGWEKEYKNFEGNYQVKLRKGSKLRKKKVLK